MSANPFLSRGRVVTLPVEDLKLRNNFEAQFRAEASRLGAWLPVTPNLEVTASLGRGRMVRLVFVGNQGRPRQSERLKAPRVCVITNTKTTLDVFVRMRAYMPLQTLVTGAGSQNVDRSRLELTLEFLRALGPNYTGLFNRAGLTRDSFHAQVFRGTTPLRTAIQASHPANQWKQVGGDVDGAILRDWSGSAVVFRGPGSAAVANRTVIAARRLRRAGLTYDLCFHFAQGAFWTVVFARRASSDEEWAAYSPTRKELGKFGALELSGIIVSVLDEVVFRALARNPRELARRYKRALVEMAVSDVLDSLLDAVA